MFKLSHTARRAAVTAGVALVAATMATPAFAKRDKPVVVPAGAIKDPTSRLCMPRTISKTVGTDKSLPATLCQTVDEWAAHGVTIVSR